MISWDFSGLHHLEAGLGKVPAAALPAAERLLGKTSLIIKKDAQRRISGHPHSPAYPYSIGYDIYHLPGEVRSRIGPDKNKRQGALGNILELGTVNNPPLPHLVPATDAEATKFEAFAAELGAKLIRDAL